MICGRFQSEFSGEMIYQESKDEKKGWDEMRWLERLF